MNTILKGLLKIEDIEQNLQYIENIFGKNSVIEFGDESRINNISNKNYFSLIIGKNGVGKSSFIKALIDKFIRESKNKDLELMLTTNSIFDDFIRGEKENGNYIYNGIKGKNNSANSKSIYNLNKIKLLKLLEKKNTKIIIDTLKYIYHLDALDIKIKFRFLDGLKELLTYHPEQLGEGGIGITRSYDLMDEIFEGINFEETGRRYLLDEIRDVFRDNKYKFNIDDISDELLIAIYFFTTISNKIEIQEGIDITAPMNIDIFSKYKRLFEELTKKYKKKYENKIKKEFNRKFLVWLKEKSLTHLTPEEKNIIGEKILKYILKEIKSPDLRKTHSIFKEDLWESNLIRAFDIFYTDTYQNIRHIQSVMSYDFYDLLNEISKIREKNWGHEAFTYDIGYIEKNTSIVKYFGNSSSGELSLLYAHLHLTDFSRRPDSKKILVIDEPEISLHPQWERDYIEKINHLLRESKLKNVFTIIVTHSPLIVLGSQDKMVKNADELENKYNVDVYCFKKDASGKTISEKLEYISIDSIDEVLGDDFGVQLYSDSYIEDITEMYTQLQDTYEISKKKHKR